jgi:hypothetical protein
VFAALVPDMNIAVPAIAFLRARGVDMVSAREEAWGDYIVTRSRDRLDATGSCRVLCGTFETSEAMTEEVTKSLTRLKPARH